jgi:Fe-S cluster biogenesis protein NfuA/nitrite reductase/ring-hydroxylating ferredoxin subunit
MPEGRNLREVGARVETLLGELRSVGDPAVSERVDEVVRLLVELYGAGLERVVEVVGREGAWQGALERLAEDDLVASLLILHGLHPVPVEERVLRALDEVRPYLGSHAGGVDFLGVDEQGVAHLALRGSCDGCPSSTVTVKLAIERAIEEAAPELAGIEVEGVSAQPAGPQLIQIQPLRAGAPDPAPHAARAGSDRAGGGAWLPLHDAAGLASGALRPVDLDGVRVVVCRAGDSLYAYRDACAACGSALAGAELAGQVLTCPSCRQRFDLGLAGRSLADPGLHLEPLPLLSDGGVTRIAVPAEARP